MRDKDALYRAVLDDPDDDALRLIYADCLEENGDPRGEFVRVQLELARLDEHHPRRPALAAREAQLIEEHQHVWAPFLSALAGKVLLRFAGGLLDEVVGMVLVDDDLPHLRGNPEVRCLNLSGEDVTDAGMPYLLDLPRLEELSLNRTAVTNDGLRTLARHPNLRVIGGEEANVDDDGLRHLHQAPRLAYVDFYGDDEGPFSFDALEEWADRRMRRWRRRSPQEKRREALLVLRMLGHYRPPGTPRSEPVRELSLSQCPLGDVELEYLTAVPELQKLVLSETHVGGSGFRHLRKLKHLRALELHRSNVAYLSELRGVKSLKELAFHTYSNQLTDEHAVALETLTGLEKLELSCWTLSEAFLPRLAKLRELRELTLSAPNVPALGEATFEALATLPHLRALRLHHLQGISEDGLAALGRMTRLEELEIAWSSARIVTDDRLHHLAGLANLSILCIEQAAVTDAGLAQLRGLRSLRLLRLPGSRATLAGAEGLLEFLPRCRVHVTAGMLERDNPERRFVRRAIDERASIEVPDDWDVRQWGTSGRGGAEQFRGELREGGFEQQSRWYTEAGPALVRIYRFPCEPRRPLAQAGAEFLRKAFTEPTTQESTASGVEMVSWRYASFYRHLDFAWRVGEWGYLLCCECVVGRYAGREPVLLRMADSFRVEDT